MDGAATRAEAYDGIDICQKVQSQNEVMVEFRNYHCRHVAEFNDLPVLTPSLQVRVSTCFMCDLVRLCEFVCGSFRIFVYFLRV